jgi:hypothetical protein
MILRSSLRLLAELDNELAQLQPSLTNLSLIAWEASWLNEGCFQCGREISNKQQAYMWMGDTGHIIMHLHCLVDWYRRQLGDVASAIDLGALGD